MSEYVLNRNHVMRSLLGRSIAFEKGQPTYVPPELVREALEIGAEPVGVENFDRASAMLGEEVDTPQPEFMSPDELVASLKKAFAQIEAKNIRNDFTAGGAPHLKSIEKILGYQPTVRERDEAWRLYKAEQVAAFDAAQADAAVAAKAP